MVNGKNYALLLPEILIKISYHVDKKDLFNCLFVNKTWNIYFIPILWRNISIRSEKTKILPEYLEAHRQYVFHLTFINVDPHRFSFNFPRLQKLILAPYKRIPFHRNQDDSPLRILELNHSIADLEHRGQGMRLNISDWNCILAYRSLKRLSLNGIYDGDCLQVFWKICERVSVLDTYFPIQPMSTLDGVTFPRMRQLSVGYYGSSESVWGVELSGKCPNLESLSSPWIPTLCPSSNSNWWEGLKKLAISKDVDDIDLSVAVKKMNQIVSLQCTGRSLGHSTFKALQSRFNTIVELKIYGYGRAYQYTQDILCAMPHLETYEGSVVTAEEVAHGQPWTCTLLTDLELQIRFKSTEDHLQPLVFKQLSRLVRLRTLDVGISFNNLLDDDADFKEDEFLKLSLDHGMHQLSNLKLLESIFTGKTNQKTTSKDVEWMEEHLVSLKSVGGSNYFPSEGSTSRITFTKY